MMQAQHEAMFHPPLPDAAVKAIERLGFGIVDKIFVDFGSPVESASASIDGFCHQGLAGGSNGDHSKPAQQEGLGQNKDINGKRADSAQPLGQKEVVSYSLLWNHDPQELEPSESQQSAAAFHKQKQDDGQADLSHHTDGQIEHQSASKGAGDKTPESHVIVAKTDDASSASLRPNTPSQGGEELPSWAQGVYTLRFAGSEFVNSNKSDAAAASNQCGVMWITGEFAQDMEATSDADLHKGIAAILQRFPALQLPKSFRVHRSVWGADPLFRGSYSYGSASATGQECQKLSEPVYNPETRTPVLLFAGEACHPQYFGCTHGAYLTGHNQAKLLLTALSTTSSVRVS